MVVHASELGSGSGGGLDSAGFDDLPFFVGERVCLNAKPFGEGGTAVIQGLTVCCPALAARLATRNQNIHKMMQQASARPDGDISNSARFSIAPLSDIPLTRGPGNCCARSSSFSMSLIDTDQRRGIVNQISAIGQSTQIPRQA